MEKDISNVDINFGEALRNLRKTHSISKKNLASMAGIAIEDIDMMESGQYSPPLETMLSICSVFKISLIDLASIIEKK